jgi:hypothetical protein
MSLNNGRELEPIKHDDAMTFDSFVICLVGGIISTATFFFAWPIHAIGIPCESTLETGTLVIEKKYLHLRGNDGNNRVLATNTGRTTGPLFKKLESLGEGTKLEVEYCKQPIGTAYVRILSKGQVVFQEFQTEIDSREARNQTILGVLAVAFLSPCIFSIIKLRRRIKTQYESTDKATKKS